MMSVNTIASSSQVTNHALVQAMSVQSQPRTRFNPLNLNRILPTIESIATGTPDHVIRQADAAQAVSNLPGLEQNRSRIEKLYSNTHIDTRHLAIDLLSDQVLANGRQNTIQSRMQMYQEHAIPLAERVARKALASSADANIVNAIGLIVFVSSTGFVAPGIDAALIERLGLRRNIARVTVNFMGCAAAMNGLRVACDHVRANPTHKALVVCLELSSINAVFEDDINDVIIHSIFGDGCAAVVVGACDGSEAAGQGKVVIHDHLSYLTENTEDGIVLGVRDNGITCKLSRQLPDYIEAGVGPVIEQFLANHQLTKADVDLWAIHPGGTRIIQRSQISLGLSDNQVADSWEVLRQYGNMLSPSVLFVMERMLHSLEQASSLEQGLTEIEQSAIAPSTTTTGIAFSFSPGVGVEGILFQRI